MSCWLFVAVRSGVQNPGGGEGGSGTDGRGSSAEQVSGGATLVTRGHGQHQGIVSFASYYFH